MKRHDGAKRDDLTGLSKKGQRGDKPAGADNSGDSWNAPSLAPGASPHQNAKPSTRSPLNRQAALEELIHRSVRQSNRTHVLLRQLALDAVRHTTLLAAAQ